MTVAIVGILATISTQNYRAYVMKGEAVQSLVDYGHIRTVIAVATQADTRTDLHKDSVAGAVPPALAGQLDPREFNGKDGVKFQLILAPAGTFASYPATEIYALLATADTPAGVRRLRVLRGVLPHVPGDKVWIQQSASAGSAQLVYPVDSGAGGGPSGPAGPPAGPDPGGGGEGGGTTELPPVTPEPPKPPPVTPEPPSSGASNVDGSGKKDGNSWTASVEVCVFGKDGKPLTGQGNTAVRYRVVTPYANFQEDLLVNSATGCVNRNYGGLPLGGVFHVEVLQVVDYNPPNSGGTSSLWDGVKPMFDLVVSQ